MVKVAVEDFTFHNITNACILLEHCGRYLLRSDATRDRMAQFVRRVDLRSTESPARGRQAQAGRPEFAAADGRDDRQRVPPG